MLNKITFKNYKAFDTASIDLKPITILLGTNSSGKSSILQSILLFEQTLNNEDKYESALRLNGKYVSLGEVDNIFRNKSLKNKLEFSFEINPNTESYLLHNIKRIQRNLRESLMRIYLDFLRFEESPIRSLSYAHRKSQIMTVDDEQFAYAIKEIKRIQKNLTSSQQTDLFSESNLDTSGNIQRTTRYKKIDVTNYKEADELIDAVIKNLNSDPFEISYEFRYQPKDNNIKVTKYSISQKTKKIIEFKVQTNKGHKKYLLESDLYSAQKLNNHRVKFGKYCDFENLSLTSKDELELDPPQIRRFSDVFSETVLKIFSRYQAYLDSAFDSDRINYVSPLRAFPKRYYFLDKSKISSSLDSIDGDNLTEILKKERTVKSSVNTWLEKFGLSVNVEDLKEVIHRLKINQNGLNLDITDVGFGISQVLPIIVQGFMSKKNSLTIIEQPEIHLHPKMQAELADLFIDVIDSDETKSKTLLIETHSESILKRLRRRIAEGKISSNDVAIYYIHGSKEKNISAVAEKLEISKTGAFDWPTEFYSTDYEDTAAFLKLQ
jgi:predicted ATPase